MNEIKAYKGVKMVKPNFQHDCVECEFLGVLFGFDFYICGREGTYPSYIIRYGNEGREYLIPHVMDEEWDKIRGKNKKAEEDHLIVNLMISASTTFFQNYFKKA
ncbi:MAG: hypothetical protein GY865_11775 [candidate division Zixibacteria bacterium]|nr:hypothetical protein [candidate division Zixibacteria bacterium]